MKGTEYKPPSIAPGREIGGCRITQFLGRGGMGEVYGAEHLALRKPVALKILLPDRATGERVDRFLEEARVASRIEHPNVVIIHDVGQQDGFHYIIMQFVCGKNLAELLRTYGGPLRWSLAVRLIYWASKGLQAVHAAGLIHRDIKPANIMLSSDSRVVLMDFGLARKEQGAGVTQVGQIVGTPAFMSPEQCRGAQLDRRSDIYSLGSTLYFLLAGKHPFSGTAHEVMAKIGEGRIPTPLHERNPAIPREVSDLVRRAMAPRPADRFPSAGVLARELKKQLRELSHVEVSTWDTQSASAADMETHTDEQLVQVELLPLETGWELVRGKVLRAGAVLAAVLSLAVIVGLHLAYPQKENLSEESTPRVRDGQVFVEAGTVRLGNDVAKLREFLFSYLSGKRLESAIRIHQQETVRQVEVPAFWIDQYEVTNSQYAAFVRETGREPPEYWKGTKPPPGKEDHPVVEVTYEDAEAYAHWVGKELPTREQWIRAFRQERDSLFPWGDVYEAGRANVGDNPKYPSTSPVKDTPRDVSPCQAYNMVGNVSEFVRGSYVHEGRTFRVGKGAEFRTEGYLKGISSWQYLYGNGLKDKGLGFRCVSEKP